MYRMPTRAGNDAASRPHYPKALLSVLEDEFQLNPDSVVLDLACGTGTVAHLLAPVVKEIVAIDHDPEMLVYAKNTSKTSNIEWRYLDANKLNNFSGKALFKLICIGRSLHLLDVERVASEAAKLVLGRGGIAVFGDKPLGGGPFGHSGISVKILARRWVEELSSREQISQNTPFVSHATALAKRAS